MNLGIRVRDVILGLSFTAVASVALSVGVWAYSNGSSAPELILEGAEPAANAGSAISALRGCWAITSSGDSPEEARGLVATWVPECPELLSDPPLEGSLDWPSEALRLPAWTLGPPAMANAITSVELSEELAPEEPASGGLLFLPAAANGAGYYVAGWASEDASGMVVGRYSQAPVSAATPVGRVYLGEEWTPKAAKQRLQQLAADDEGHQARVRQRRLEVAHEKDLLDYAPQ